MSNSARHFNARPRDLRRHEHLHDFVFFEFGGRWNIDFELFGQLDQLVLRLLAELVGGLYRRYFYLRKLIVIDRRMLSVMVPPARSPASSAAAWLR